MEGSNVWAVASGSLTLVCLPSHHWFPKKPSPATKHNPHPVSAWTLEKMSSHGEEDSCEDLSEVGIKMALQPDPRACVLGCHTRLKTSKHAQHFSCTPCHVWFLTFPLRDSSTGEENIIHLIWSLGTSTKGKNNNSAAALLICTENLGSFFADPTGLPHTAVKLYACNPERQLEFSATGCQMSCSYHTGLNDNSGIILLIRYLRHIGIEAFVKQMHRNFTASEQNQTLNFAAVFFFRKDWYW